MAGWTLRLLFTHEHMYVYNEAQGFEVTKMTDIGIL